MRFLLEVAGQGENDGQKQQGFNQDNITKALMSSMVQSNQYAEFGGVSDAKRDMKLQKEIQMKQVHDADKKEISQPGNPLIKSTKQKQLEYLK